MRMLRPGRSVLPPPLAVTWRLGPLTRCTAVVIHGCTGFCVHSFIACCWALVLVLVVPCTITVRPVCILTVLAQSAAWNTMGSGARPCQTVAENTHGTARGHQCRRYRPPLLPLQAIQRCMLLVDAVLENTQNPGCTSCTARMVIREMDSSLRALASSPPVVTEVGTADAATASNRAASHHRQVAAAAHCKSRIPRHKADVCLPDLHQARGGRAVLSACAVACRAGASARARAAPKVVLVHLMVWDCRSNL